MYLRDLGVSLLRRWYVVVLGLILTAAACLSTYLIVLPDYEARSSLLLLPPSRTAEETGNPYLFLGGLGQALDVLIVSMNADSARKPMEDEFPDVSFVVERDGTTSAPIMVITATSHSANSTTAALEVLIGAVPPALASIQDPLEVPADARISSAVLATDESPTKNSKSRLRALVAVAAVCLTASVLFAGFIDRVVTSRRARRFSVRGGETDDENLPTPDVTQSRKSNVTQSRKSKPDRLPAATDGSPPPIPRSSERLRLGLASTDDGRPQDASDGARGDKQGNSGVNGSGEPNVDRGRHRPAAQTRG